MGDPPFGLGEELVCDLIYTYGSAYREVLQYLDREGARDTVLPVRHEVLKAQILFGIRNEMAIKLDDIIFRRTAVGTSGSPDDHLLAFCAEVSGNEIGWNKAAIERELKEVKGNFAYASVY